MRYIFGLVSGHFADGILVITRGWHLITPDTITHVDASDLYIVVVGIQENLGVRVHSSGSTE